MTGTDDKPVVVVATITPLEGREADIEKALREAIPVVQEETGCLLYALHRAPSGAFVMVEKWTSAETLRAHAKGEASAALNAALAGAVTSPPDVQVLTPLPEGDAHFGTV